jgi:hypothetical protein
MASLDTFPSISDAEFRAACKALEDRCFDRLGGTDWLSVRWSGEELVIKQRRQISNSSPTRTKNNTENEGLEDHNVHVEDGSGSDNPDIIVRMQWPLSR